jgi:hypothetical protein
MTTVAPPPRTPARLAAPTALVAMVPALVIAFVLGPPRLAGDRALGEPGGMEAAFRPALVDYWRSRDPSRPPAVQRLVDYWFRWHLIKIGIAALMLIVLVALTVMLWRAFLRTDRRGAGRTAALVSAGIALPAAALFALFVLVANINTTAVPFPALFPFLVDGAAPDPALAGVLEQARARLTGSHLTSGYTPPALNDMVADLARYHTVLAVIAAGTTVAFAGLAVVLWRRFARTAGADRRTRRVLGWFGAVAVMVALLSVVFVVADVTAALDPAPDLLALLNGSGDF